MDNGRSDKKFQTHQGDDNLAVRVSLELVRRKLSTKLCLVVDLSVNGKNIFSIVADEWLGTSVYHREHGVSKTRRKLNGRLLAHADDGQTLMSED